MAEKTNLRFQIGFDADNPRELLEYNLLASMSKKERREFLHLAISLIGERIGYIYPPSGMIGIMSACMFGSERTSVAAAPVIRPPIVQTKPAKQDKPKAEKPQSEQPVFTKREESVPKEILKINEYIPEDSRTTEYIPTEHDRQLAELMRQAVGNLQGE